MIKDAGKRLKQERVDNGYALNTVSQMTKIQKSDLKAIEEANYEDISNPLLIADMIREYAEALNMDGDEFVEPYLPAIEELKQALREEEEVLSRVQSQSTEAKTTADRVFEALPTIGLVAVIVVIMITIVIAIQRSSTKETKTEVASVVASHSAVSSVEPDDSVSETPAESSQADDKEAAESTESPSVAEDIKNVAEAGEEARFAMKKDLSTYKIEIVGHGFVWFGLIEDGVVVFDSTVDDGESYEFQVNKGVEELTIQFGYPQGASIRINGKELDLEDYPYPNIHFFQADDASVEETASETDDEKEADLEEEVEERASTSNESAGDYQGPAVLAPDFNMDAERDRN